MPTAIATKRLEPDRNGLQRTAMHRTPAQPTATDRNPARPAGGRLHQTAQETLITDDMLRHVQSEKNLLRLYAMVFEAAYPERAARKFFPEFVGVGERMWDYFNAGAKILKPTQWVALQKGSGITLYQRWVNIQCTGIPPNDDSGI